MKAKRLCIDVPVRFILAAAFLITASKPAFLQSSQPGGKPPPTQSRIGRSLDPRLQHTLNLLVSEKQLQTIAQLDREAALLSAKYSRRIRAIANSRTDTATDLTSAEKLRELGSQAGASERQLFLALERERAGVNRAFNTTGTLSLIQPLNLAGIEAARIIRLRTGSLATEVPDLGKAALCRGDIVTDRLLYRYVRAATAEDDAEVIKALRAIQIQLACMSTRQVRIFEGALVKGVEWTETVVAPPSVGSKRSRVLDAFRQLVAPIIFATADASRLFAKHDRPAIKWLSTHKEMLAASAMRKETITYRVGLLFANRFSGKLLRLRGECAPGAKKIFSDGRGGLTCNPLGAFFRSSMLACDVTQWVPERSSGAGKFVCEIGCAGLPGSEKLEAGARRSPSRVLGQSRSDCPYGGPQLGTGGAGDTGGSSGTPGGAGSGGSGSGAGPSCDAVDPMYGVITGHQTPAQAYNQAYNACLMGMAGRGHTSLAADAEGSGYAPGGGKNCMLATSDTTEDDDKPPEDDERNPDNNVDNTLKEKVKSILDGIAWLVNAILGSEVISANAVEFAKTAVDNATYGETGQCPGGPCEGSTSLDGKTIKLNRNTCANEDDCFNALVHEAMHSLFNGSPYESVLSGTEFEDLDHEHRLFGWTSGDTINFLAYWSGRNARTPQSCLPDDPSCTEGCTSREAAAPDCMKAGLDASNQRRREMQQKADDCSTDGCWNPNTDDGTGGGQQCGTPNPCPGQSVALCMEDQPNCMCGKGTRGLDVGAMLRNQVWRDYCTMAHDDRCSSPTAPEDFGASSGASPPGLRSVTATPATTRVGLTFSGGAITIRPDGRVTLGRSQRSQVRADDPDCTSNLCRASQRGDW